MSPCTYWCDHRKQAKRQVSPKQSPDGPAVFMQLELGCGEGGGTTQLAGCCSLSGALLCLCVVRSASFSKLNVASVCVGLFSSALCMPHAPLQVQYGACAAAGWPWSYLPCLLVMACLPLGLVWFGCRESRGGGNETRQERLRLHHLLTVLQLPIGLPVCSLHGHVRPIEQHA